MTSYNYGFGQEPDAKADDPAEDIDFDEMLDRIQRKPVCARRSFWQF